MPKSPAEVMKIAESRAERACAAYIEYIGMQLEDGFTGHAYTVRMKSKLPSAYEDYICRVYSGFGWSVAVLTLPDGETSFSFAPQTASVSMYAPGTK